MHPSLLEWPAAPVQQVRLWTTNLDLLSDVEVAKLSGLLDQTEQVRGARFHFEQDARHFRATRGLLRSLLGGLVEAEPASLAFSYGPHGKPTLISSAGERELHFNLSHSGGWGLFAVSREAAVGVDLEGEARLEGDEAGLLPLARRVLSAGEFAAWETLPTIELKRAGFLRAWTRKEAYAKACGRGVFEVLESVEVAIDAHAPQDSIMLRSPASDSCVGSHWLVHDLPAPEGFVAAMAAEQSAGSNVARKGRHAFLSGRHA